MKPAVLVAIGLVLGAIVAALVIAAPILPGVDSDQADRTDAIYYYMIGLCGLIFGVVTVVLVYSVWKFRGDHGDLSDGPPIHGITWLEGLWTAIPTIIVVSIVAISWIVLSRNDDSEASGRINVHIHAYQFGWSYDYVDPEYGIKNSDTLALPTGVPVRFEITTNDVIHSWWVPDWRLQMNATPGQTNILSVTPKGTGEHDIVCAFLCGIGHAGMNSEVGEPGKDGKPQSLIKRIQVMSQADFDTWVAGKQKEAQEAAAKPGAEGIAVFNAERLRRLPLPGRGERRRQRRPEPRDQHPAGSGAGGERAARGLRPPVDRGSQRPHRRRLLRHHAQGLRRQDPARPARPARGAPRGSAAVTPHPHRLSIGEIA